MTGLNEGSSLHSIRETPQDCLDVVFNESNIVNTLQILLTDTTRTIDDICALCIAMIKSQIVLAFTSQGLVPIAGDHSYVFPFHKMSKQQLGLIETEVSSPGDFFYSAYENDTFMIMNRRKYVVDPSVLLFGLTCIMVHGLSNVTASKHGDKLTKLEAPQIAYHVNATIFRIVNACAMPQDPLSKTEKLLALHGVFVTEDT